MQHVQVPNDMTNSGNLSPKDLLIYATIKSHLNKITKTCFPSLSTIAKESGISRPTVIKSIEALKKAGYISVTLEGRKNIYSFSPYKNFEPFSFEFLKLEMNPNIKAFLIASQQFMFKDIEGFGKMSYSDSELAKKVNIDRHTVSKYIKELEDSEFLTTIRTNNRDPITGIQINEKFFHLNELGQAIIWELQKQKEDIEELKSASKSTSKDIKLLQTEVDRLKKKEEKHKVLEDIILNYVSKEELEQIISSSLSNLIIL